LPKDAIVEQFSLEQAVELVKPKLAGASKAPKEKKKSAKPADVKSKSTSKSKSKPTK
jgi:topoisomerase IA-like protein